MLVSVVVCTFNPSKDYFTRTLDSLAAQTLPFTEWELILVDNNSDSPLAMSYPVNWHPNARWLHEPEQGKVAAMARGLKCATADLIITIDDDNLPASDYLTTALKILGDNPHLGAFGSGRTEGAYEAEPPSWFKPDIAAYLALRQVDQATMYETLEGGENCRPWGLGLCVTGRVASAWLSSCMDILSRYPNLNGRKGTVLDDDLFSLCAISNGLSYGIFPELRLTHLIAPSRLDISYLAELAFDHGYSHAHYALISGEQLSNPIRIGSTKAALVLFLSRKPKLAYEELLHFFHHVRQANIQRILRAYRAKGWDRALNAINSNRP